MQITSIRREEDAQSVRAIARVEWEDCERPALDLYFQTAREFGDSLRCDANMFLTAAIIPAAFYGERRVRIEGSVCPVLLAGVQAALRQLQQWYGPLAVQTSIEPSAGWHAATGPAIPRAACFLSGGVDSLALLRTNRQQFPREHPRYFQDGILIFGADMGCHPDYVSSQRRRYADVCARLQQLADATGLRLLPLETNAKFLETDYAFWCDWFTGPVMGAVAQSLSAHITDVSLGSPGWVGRIPPCGTHPFVDGNCATAAVRVHHEQSHLRRLEKIRIIADWPEALANLRVCFHYFYRKFPDDQLNCGHCNRCVYTTLELIAVGCQEDSPTLPVGVLTGDHVAAMSPLSRWAAGHLDEVVAPLRSAGRDDLARAVQQRLRRDRRESAWWYPQLKPAIRRFDERMTGGRLRSLFGAFRK